MDAEVAAAHERMVEQTMSDERLLGALPEDAAGRLLDWAVQRLTTAAETAHDLSSYEAAADAVRQEARQIADGVAEEGGDLEALERRLSPVAAPTLTMPGHECAADVAPAEDPHEAARTDGAVEPVVGPEPPVESEPPAVPVSGEPVAGAQSLSDELRAALDDAVERVRSLFGRRSDKE